MRAPRSSTGLSESEERAPPVHSSGLLLLLMSSMLTDVHRCDTMDFVCSSRTRRMLNIMNTLENKLGISGDSDRLPLQIQLPCVRVHKASWDKKSFQQKRALVLASLQVLLDAVKLVEGKSNLQHQKSLLQLLQHNVENHILILKRLKIQEEPRAPEEDCKGQKTFSLRQTLKQYRYLLQGRLELLVRELQHTCPPQTTTDSW